MRPYDVNDGIATELPQMICANNHVVVTAPKVIHAGFELNEVIYMRSALGRPVHAADDAIERKIAFGVATRQLLENLQHSVRIKATVSKVSIRIRSKFELASFLRRRSIDPGGGKALDMFTVLARVNHMDGLVATFETIFDKWQQHTIFLVIVIKQCTNMTHFTEFGTGKGNGAHRFSVQLLIPDLTNDPIPCGSPAVKNRMYQLQRGRL
jgi:hypothetical protein